MVIYIHTWASFLSSGGYHIAVHSTASHLHNCLKTMAIHLQNDNMNKAHISTSTDWTLAFRSCINTTLASSCLDHPVHWEYLAKKAQPCLNLLSQLSIFSEQDYKHDHHSAHVSVENFKSMFGGYISLLYRHEGKNAYQIISRCQSQETFRDFNSSLITASTYAFTN